MYKRQISKSAESDEALFRRLYKAMPQRGDETEPMLNIISWRKGEEFISVVIPRETPRPEAYFAEGLPNVIVTALSVVMYMQLGLTDAEVGLYLSLIHI